MGIALCSVDSSDGFEPLLECFQLKHEAMGLQDL